jgi:hypothetical protein
MIELQDPTLAGCKGQRRIRKLEERRLNCWLQVLQLLDQVQCMDDEIKELEKEAIEPE